MKKAKTRPKRTPKPKPRREGQGLVREIKAEAPPQPRFFDLRVVKGSGGRHHGDSI